MKPKNIFNWRLALGLGLLLASLLIYATEYLLLHNRQEIMTYFLNDLAFVPLSVLLVTLVLDQIMQGREKQNRLNKTNMVIGAFFSEMGNQLLRTMAALDPERQKMAEEFSVRQTWSEADFRSLKKLSRGNKCSVTLSQSAFDDLKERLVSHRGFMLRLLENQTLLEHEQFTDLLWASFHLADELSLRGNYETLPEPDRQHLALDAKRVYLALSAQWVDYLLHLKNAYPFLFSLAVRMNPFNNDAQPTIRKA
jgi:hypothetical protein